MAAAFVHVLIPQTGRVELLHPMTAEALGLEVVDPAEVEAPVVEVETPQANVVDPGQTSEPVVSQQDSATE